MRRLTTHLILAAALALPAPGFAQSVQTKQYDDGGVYEGQFGRASCRERV